MANRGALDRALDTFDRLSTREKMMVGGLVSTLIITALVMVWVLVGRKLDQLQIRNDTLRTQIAEIDASKHSFLRNKARMEAWQRQLDRNDIKLVKVMEDDAKALGFEIEDFREAKRVLTENHRRVRKREGDKKGVKDLVERSQTVTIRRVSLKQLADFLARLEGRVEPVKITKLNASILASNRQMLREVSMTVATYRNEEVEP